MYKYDETDFRVRIAALGLKFFGTGSRFICNPPVTDTDADFVVLDTKKTNWVGQYGFDEVPSQGGGIGYEQDDNLQVYRKGEVNIMVTSDPKLWWKWKVATAAAKQMNILDKQRRIDLFQGVLYGNW